MKLYECAICSRPVDRSLVCKQCRREHDLTSAWAVDLIESAKQWRNMERRDDYHGVATFSDYIVQQQGEVYDGWDILDGEISGPTGDPFLNAMGVSDIYFPPEEEWWDWNEQWTVYTVYV